MGCGASNGKSEVTTDATRKEKKSKAKKEKVKGLPQAQLYTVQTPAEVHTGEDAACGRGISDGEIQAEPSPTFCKVRELKNRLKCTALEAYSEAKYGSAPVPTSPRPGGPIEEAADSSGGGHTAEYTVKPELKTRVEAWIVLLQEESAPGTPIGSEGLSETDIFHCYSDDEVPPAASPEHALDEEFCIVRLRGVTQLKRHVSQLQERKKTAGEPSLYPARSFAGSPNRTPTREASLKSDSQSTGGSRRRLSVLVGAGIRESDGGGTSDGEEALVSPKYVEGVRDLIKEVQRDIVAHDLERSMRDQCAPPPSSPPPAAKSLPTPPVIAVDGDGTDTTSTEDKEKGATTPVVVFVGSAENENSPPTPPTLLMKAPAELPPLRLPSCSGGSKSSFQASDNNLLETTVPST